MFTTTNVLQLALVASVVSACSEQREILKILRSKVKDCKVTLPSNIILRPSKECDSCGGTLDVLTRLYYQEFEGPKNRPYDARCCYAKQLNFCDSGCFNAYKKNRQKYRFFDYDTTTEKLTLHACT